MQLDVDPDALADVAGRAGAAAEVLGHVARHLHGTRPGDAGPLDRRVADPLAVWLRHETARLAETGRLVDARAHQLREVARAYRSADAAAVGR